MLREAVILAGGLGTRLAQVVKNVPKSMANVSGKPFLKYLLDYLVLQKIDRVILAVGFKNEIIRRYFGQKYNGLEICYSVEKEPLGTGGAILRALHLVDKEDIFILNGDTYCNICLQNLYRFHKAKNADLSMAVKKVNDISRYGTVNLDKKGMIVAFKEKNLLMPGFMNCGLYVLKSNLLRNTELNRKFSFEKDFLEKYFNKYQFYGFPIHDSFFVDIGVPEDYLRSQTELKKALKLKTTVS